MTEDEMVGWHHQLNGHGFILLKYNLLHPQPSIFEPVCVGLFILCVFFNGI